jgi:di/tricarboxylate transporter
MQTEQVLILSILAATVALFLWGRWRHDMVAAASLLACVFTGLVAPETAFAGFGHPAVVTVACVLILSRGLQTTGAVDALTRRLLPAQAGPVASMAALTGLAALLSAFMNNVGALALLMPVALQLARKLELPPGRLLMPLAFGSILGGMTTLIGTPPNLIVAGFRAEATGSGFSMFDYSWVGVAVALGGLLLIIAGGWRLVPARREAVAEGFESGAYLTEARVPEGSASVGRRLRDIEKDLADVEAQIVGLVRNELRLNAPHPARIVRAGDILVVEAEADALADLLSKLELKLEEAKSTEPEQADEDEEAADADGEQAVEDKDQSKSGGVSKDADADPAAAEHADDAGEKDSQDANTTAISEVRDEGEVRLVELAVLPGASISGRTASDLLLRSSHGINLLAVSRQGRRSLKRLREMSLLPGDLLLLQGTPEAIASFAAQSGCVPLAERELRIPNRRRAITAGLVMLAAIAGAAFGLLPAAVSFAAGVLASMALRTVPPRAVYEAVDWPVIVLLAALIPVAGAMESSGAADLIAAALLEDVAQGHPVLALGLVLVVTMTLSDLMNNAATAAVMCPIAIGTASVLDANPDAFLMAVAIGASCAFLTPIGHQNNTLILGPGGFRFSDYWRLGLPMEIVVVAISMPLLLWAWPL